MKDKLIALILFIAGVFLIIAGIVITVTTFTDIEEVYSIRENLLYVLFSLSAGALSIIGSAEVIKVYRFNRFTV